VKESLSEDASAAAAAAPQSNDVRPISAEVFFFNQSIRFIALNHVIHMQQT